MRIFFTIFIIFFNFLFFLPGEDEDRLEGARDEEHPHRQLPDEHIVREVRDVLVNIICIGTDAILSSGYLGWVEK